MFSSYDSANTHDSQATSSLLSSNGISIIENEDFSTALSLVKDQLFQFSQSSVAIDVLESIFNVADASVAKTIVEDWQNNIFSTIPNIRILEATVLSGAKGAYSAQTNEIYLSDSLLKTDNLTGLSRSG